MNITVQTLFQNFKREILPLPSRVILVTFFLFLLFIPLITQSSYVLRTLSFACMWAIYAAGWDILSGYTGQFSFGQAMFFGVSAYTCALLNLQLGFPPWLTIPIGAIAALAFGLIVGVPCLRLKRIYLALATLTFPIMLMGLVFAFPEQSGGELGFYDITRLSHSPVVNYYIGLGLMVFTAFTLWRVTNSRLGIIFQAIREGEMTTKASGIDITRYKLLAFSISGFFSGLAGGYYAHFMGTVGPTTLSVTLSFEAVIFTVFGGIGTIYGAIGGAWILTVVTEYLRVASEMRMLILVILVVLVLLFMPGGILRWSRDKLEKVCPNCKQRNAFNRKSCRVCGAPL